jgi:hypothetical protein
VHRGGRPALRRFELAEIGWVRRSSCAIVPSEVRTSVVEVTEVINDKGGGVW